MAAIKLNGRTPEATEFRAERVIVAARELAYQGGYEAVQMRAVARSARIALATLYRYYPSKDDLLAGVVDREISRFAKEVDDRPSRHRTAAGRAADTFVRAFRGITTNRGYAHAIMTSYHVPVVFEESQIRAADGEVRPVGTNEFLNIAARAAWGVEHHPTRAQYRGLQILEALWASSLIGWLNSTLSTAEVEKRLKIAAEAVLES